MEHEKNHFQVPQNFEIEIEFPSFKFHGVSMFQMILMELTNFKNTHVPWLELIAMFLISCSVAPDHRVPHAMFRDTHQLTSVP